MTNTQRRSITEEAVSRLSNCENPRTKEISEALIRHLHAFVQEVNPTPEEWFQGIQFLTDTGQMCDYKRQEYILLSDVLGVSMLVDELAFKRAEGATESSVLGPFYVEGSPEVTQETDLAKTEGERVHVHGTVRDLAGNPVPGALLDIWHTAPNGLYHMQDSAQDDFHLCGKLHTDNEGKYSFYTVPPVSYSIPTDGPVGKYLLHMGRHPFRPAHIHFIVTAEGYDSIVTQVFLDCDQ